MGPQIGARLIVSSPKHRNDRKTGFRPSLDKGAKARPPRVSGADSKDWLWGVHAVVTPDVHSMTEATNRAAKVAQSEGFAVRGEEIVVTAGVPFGQPGSTNALRVATVK